MGLEEKLQVVRNDFVVYRYDVPVTLQKAGGAKSLGIRELTSEEELLAAKLGNFSMMKGEYEAVKLSICELDGKSVTNADGVIDAFWEKCGAKLRTLLLKAHSRVNNPAKEEDADFFKSEKAAV